MERGKWEFRTQGKTGFEKIGSILNVPQITPGEAAGTMTGTFVGRSFNKPRLRGAHTAQSAPGQSCTWLVPPGTATVLIPPARGPHPSLLPAARTGPYSLPNVSGEALQGHIIQGQVAQASELGEALRKPVRT